MKYNDLLVYEPGNQYPEPSKVAPYTTLPSWWRKFVFSILNGREFQVYMYIAMATDGRHAVSYPRIEEIKNDMVLKSDSQVYEALKSLEALGFIRRQKSRLPNRISQTLRNVYQRTAPEFLLITLLKNSHPDFGGKPGDKAIDEYLDPGCCPIDFHADTEDLEPRGDVLAGFQTLLGRAKLTEFLSTPNSGRREVLISLLEDNLRALKIEATKRYKDLPLAPKDRQRAKLRQHARANQNSNDQSE